MLFVDPSDRGGFSLSREHAKRVRKQRSFSFVRDHAFSLSLSISYARIKGKIDVTQIRGDRAPTAPWTTDDRLSPQLRSAGLSFSITDETGSGMQTERIKPLELNVTLRKTLFSSQLPWKN